MTFRLKDAEKLVKNVEAQLYLEQFAQMNLFWVLKTASIQPGLIHYLGADGIAYAMMDDIDDRVAKCITFLEEMGCPVFSTVEEMDAYVSRLQGGNQPFS